MLNALRIIDSKELYDTLSLNEEWVNDIEQLIDTFDLISDNNLF